MPEPAAEKGQSYRCGICAINWPQQPKFSTCPECDNACSRFQQMTPISNDDAQRRLNYVNFEKKYGPADLKAHDRWLKEKSDAEMNSMATAAGIEPPTNMWKPPGATGGLTGL